MRPCYVYVISSEDGSQKIGVSYSPERRLIDLQGANGNVLRLSKKWRLPDCRAAQEVEIEAHKELADQRLAGEWFAVTVDAACKAVNAIASRYPNTEPIPTEEPQPSRPHYMQLQPPAPINFKEFYWRPMFEKHGGVEQVIAEWTTEIRQIAADLGYQ